jgi:hypothetical protein
MYSKLSSLLWFPPEAHHEVTSKLESLLYPARRDFHCFWATLAS